MVWLLTALFQCYKSFSAKYGMHFCPLVVLSTIMKGNYKSSWLKLKNGIRNNSTNKIVLFIISHNNNNKNKTLHIVAEFEKC